MMKIVGSDQLFLSHYVANEIISEEFKEGTSIFNAVYRCLHTLYELARRMYPRRLGLDGFYMWEPHRVYWHGFLIPILEDVHFDYVDEPTALARYEARKEELRRTLFAQLSAMPPPPPPPPPPVAHQYQEILHWMDVRRQAVVAHQRDHVFNFRDPAFVPERVAAPQLGRVIWLDDAPLDVNPD